MLCVRCEWAVVCQHVAILSLVEVLFYLYLNVSLSRAPSFCKLCVSNFRGLLILWGAGIYL
jgi:hypothetical protein